MWGSTQVLADKALGSVGKTNLKPSTNCKCEEKEDELKCPNLICHYCEPATHHHANHPPALATHQCAVGVTATSPDVTVISAGLVPSSDSQ